MSRVAVYGAGAVGGYLAWHLARAGHSVSVVARGDHLAAMRREGLVLEANGQPVGRVPIACSDDPVALGRQDMVFVTVKHPSLASAADGLRQFASERTPFVFATNGVPWWMEPDLDILDPDRRLADIVAPAMRVGCIAKASLEVTAPGVVSMDTSSARFILGPASGAAEDAARSVFELLGGAAIQSSFAADLRPAVWEKLLLNLGFGLPAAILGLPVGAYARQPEAQAYLADLFAEIRAIAQSCGVTLALPEGVATDPAILSSPHLPSLLQDLQRGRAAEIDALVTAPLLIARRAALSIPILEQMGALITAKARALGSYEGSGVAGHA